MNSKQANADIPAVLASTRALIDWTRGQAGHCYADDHFSPISDLDLEIIARRFSCRLKVDVLPSGVQEVGIPGYMGNPTIVVSRDLPSGHRRLAARHGLAHLVAGELEGEHDSGVRFMSSVLDHMTLEERRADLFGLADLIPDRDLATIVRVEPSPEGAREWMRHRIRELTPGWPEQRLEDRASLRWALFFAEETL